MSTYIYIYSLEADVHHACDPPSEVENALCEDNKHILRHVHRAPSNSAPQGMREPAKAGEETCSVRLVCKLDRVIHVASAVRAVW